MGRQIPWNSIDELISLLETQRDLLDDYIEAVKAAQDPQFPGGREAVMLCQYLLLGNAQKAAQWANGLGWRRASKNRKGEPTLIDYQGDDVLEWIDRPPANVPVKLAEICRVVSNRQWRSKD